MSHLIQYTRLTTSDKLTDRFLTSQVYKPASSDQFKAGIVFSQIEILSPWFPTSQIGQTIINTVIREYYRGTDTSELVNFENALRKINETLSQIAQNGEADWVGNLNGIISLVNGREVHFSQTGHSKAYLFREGKINHITEGLAPEAEPHPLKTFSNITSGTLQLHDKILIGNSSLFDQLTLDVLRDIVENNSPALAAMELAALIKRERIKNTNAIILELTTKDEVANLPLEHKIDTVYLDQITAGVFWQNINKFFAEYSGPAWSKTKEWSADLWQKTKTGFTNKVLPGLKKGGARLHQASGTGWQKVSIYSQKTSASLKTKIKQSAGAIDQKMEQPQGAERTKKPPHPAIQKTSAFLLNLTQKVRQITVWRTIKERVNELELFSGNRKYITLAGILIFILIVSIWGGKIKRNKPQISENKVAQVIENIKTDYDQAQLSLSIAETSKAIDFYQKAIDGGTTIPESSSYFGQAQDLIQKSESAIDELTQTKRPKAKIISDNAGDTQNIKIADSDAYLFTSSQIKKIALIGSEPRVLATLSTESGNIKAVDFDQESKQLLNYTDQNKIVVYNLETKKLEPILSQNENSWESADKIKVFDSNIYLLSLTNKQIIKHSATDNGEYLGGSLFVSGESVDFDKVTDWAIDGRILLLQTDGKIQVVSRVGSEMIELKNIPVGKNITRPARIFADFNSDSIFILDAQSERTGRPKLYEFNKTGEFIQAYLLSADAKNLSDIEVSFKERKVWVLAQNKIIEFTLP